MQLTLSFAMLLGSIFALSTLPTDVAAMPLPQTGIVTLPLQRIGQRGDLHPRVLLQQHINRATRRLARMTGREVPSDADLLSAIVKRKTRIGRPGAGLKTDAFVATGSGHAKVSGSHSFASEQSDLTPANAPTANDSLGLDIEDNDVGYIATVQIGTPPRDFKLLMDSGSADLWVGGEGCQSEDGGDCGNHVFLGELTSSSFVDTKKPFQVAYGSGRAAGNIITDNLSFGGLTLPNHTFGAAAQESVDFSDDSTPFDGLMGLALSSLSEQKVLTPVESLAKAGLIKAPITSYKISRLDDLDNDGEITFGGLDGTKFDPKTLVNVPNVNQNGFWEAAVDGVSIDGSDLGLQNRTAILDTGTTLFIVPSNDAGAILGAIPGSKTDGQGGFTVPCNFNNSIALTFGGQQFSIDPRDIALQNGDGKSEGDCSSGITAGTVGGAQEWLVGDVFLKNAYYSTNVADNSISLAKLV
ncbi:aspartic peptidase A1 [Auriscalpium vulgare]|uniref:Aspartic peptidase A1 n=1 Tax=Auriscalpium vulgare TaxID=40419 RepID=A0ACB8S3X8_9AGAM|nr:aspartic peptidase A1 [Auriscalpium vulgare]